MEGIAIVTSLVVAALIVYIAYLYAARQAPPSIQKIINWVVFTFQRGINVVASFLGQQPVFKLSAFPEAVQKSVEDVERVLETAEQAIESTVTPGVVPEIGKSQIKGVLGSAVDTGLGYCYVGRSNTGRVCAPVTRKSGCMSREYYASLEKCQLSSR